MDLLIGFGLGIGFHIYDRCKSKIKFLNDMKAQHANQPNALRYISYAFF